MKSSSFINVCSRRRRCATFHGCLAGKHQPKRGSSPRLRIEDQLSTQPLRDESMNDVKTQPRSPFTSTGRKKWIEGLFPHVLRHSDAVVRNNNVNIFLVQGPRLYYDAPATAFRKGMRHRVKEK